MKRRRWFIGIILGFFLLGVNPRVTRRVQPALADELEDVLNQLDDKKTQKTTKELEAEKAKQEAQTVSGQIKSTQGAIVQTEGEVKDKEGQILSLEDQRKAKEADLEQKTTARDEALRLFYKLSRTNPTYFFLNGAGLSDLARFWNGYKTSLAQVFSQILNLNGAISSIKADLGITTDQKLSLEGEVKSLTSQKVALEAKKSDLTQYQEILSQEINGLENEIAALTARQQSILAARFGSFTTSVGEVPLPDDFNASPAYNPGFSPAFAAFSFGAFTHRKGMSQYGAKGRAEQGQDYKAILKAYYGKDVTTKETGGTIGVAGFGELDFEGYYLMGIAEMPASFPMQALKAQAVAARSYAWRYKIAGQSICTSEACQVFSNAKAQNPPAAWRQAVEETKGELVEDVITYYSSTAGGYLTTMGWDTTEGQSGGDWTNRAYESLGKSPWFYKAWYTEGYSVNSGKCGREHPWLNQEEMVDILNAYVVLEKGTQEEVDRVLPLTINSCPISGGSGDPLPMEEMRAKAAALGEGYTSVSDVSTAHSGNGETSQVTLTTNRGVVSISGANFKRAFNLRAPGYISIKSPLYQMVRK